MNRSAAVPFTIVSNNHGFVQVYKRIDMIGAGGFGKVYKVIEQKTQQTYALKVVPNDSLTSNVEKEALQNEINFQKSCNHQNIVKVIHTFTDSLNQYIVLEYCPGGSLEAKSKKDGRFTSEQAADFVKQALDALAYIHARGIIHRDIKLANFLIGENGQIKLCDFGLAMKISPNERYQVSGTPSYLAPELLLKGGEGINPKIDIWALGICVFILLNGYPPFEASTPKLTYERIKNGTFRFNIAANITYFAKDFIQKTLTRDPDQRPSAEELLKHQLVTKGQEKQVIKTSRSFSTMPHMTPNALAKSPLTPISPVAEQPEKKTPASILAQASAPELKLTPISIASSPLVESQGAEERLPPQHSVCRFWDLSDKYGLGYLLQDGSVGALFNDMTKMIADPHRTFIQYYNSPHTVNFELVDANTPIDDVSKKLIILSKFSDSLRKGNDLYKIPPLRSDKNSPLNYVRHWSREDRRVLFRFDNGDVQVNFEDSMKLFIFWADQKLILSSGLKKPAKCIAVTDVSDEGNEEEKTRLAVAKRMLKATRASSSRNGSHSK